MKTLTSDLHVVIGLGATGFSCVQYLKQCGVPVAVTDTRENPPFLTELKKNYSDVQLALGQLDPLLLRQAAKIILSPGIALSHPLIAEQAARGIPVVGDIELFSQSVNAPVVAITGTNAKSTVTTLVGKMAEASGLQVKVGGNLGVPVLNFLRAASLTELYVLELSSFQLESTYSLKPSVASLLNISPDHMDRYPNFEAYHRAKMRVYQNCQMAVCNREEVLTDYNHPALLKKFYFTEQKPGKNEFGLILDKTLTLAFEDQPLIAVSELPVKGKHYYANALAALAIGYSLGWSFDAMVRVLRTFKGLPHRCQFIREYQGVSFYDDSKGTNVGASLAAIMGLGSELKGKLILIAGGLGKNADFRPLVPALKKYVRHAVLIGEAAKEMAGVWETHIPLSFATTMEEAVMLAAKMAEKGDSVLLSPACASFDMFQNFEHRGQVFTEIVLKNYAF